MQIRRAVSPVIAMILLIGLTVAAGSLIFITVLPMLEPKGDIEILNVYYYYNEGITVPKKNPKAQADAYVVEFEVYNAGTKVLQVKTVAIEDRDGVEIDHELHTDENLGMDFASLERFEFILSFTIKKNPPQALMAVVTTNDGRTYKSEFVSLE